MLVRERLSVVLASLTLATLVACGGDKQSHESFQVLSPVSATTTPAPGTTPVANDPALVKALLVPEDLGPSWTSPPLTGAPTRARNLFCGEDIAVGNWPDGAIGLLLDPDNFVLEALEVPAGGTATQLLDRLREVTRTCREWVSTDGSMRTDWKIEPTEFASFGDDTVALKGTAHVISAGHLNDAFLIIIRRENALLFMVDVALSDLDRSAAEEIARRADAKLASVNPGAP